MMKIISPHYATESSVYPPIISPAVYAGDHSASPFLVLWVFLSSGLNSWEDQFIQQYRVRNTGLLERISTSSLVWFLVLIRLDDLRRQFWRDRNLYKGPDADGGCFR